MRQGSLEDHTLALEMCMEHHSPISKFESFKSNAWIIPIKLLTDNFSHEKFSLKQNKIFQYDTIIYFPRINSRFLVGKSALEYTFRFGNFIEIIGSTTIPSRKDSRSGNSERIWKARCQSELIQNFFAENIYRNPAV